MSRLDAAKVGKSIAFLRNFYGMTQRELADKLNVTDKAVSRWERGIGSPDISLLTKLSNVLDIDIESILEGNLTHLELHWKGILVLNYPDGMTADTQMFGKRLLYFQLGFFLLSGIKEIYVFGVEKDISFAKDMLGEGKHFGITLIYQIFSSKEMLLHQEESELFKKQNKSNGILLIDGLDFLYGKDITKYFRRLMMDTKVPVQLANFCGISTSIYFYPKVEKESLQVLANKELEKRCLERGVILFPIKTKEDLLDAAIFLKIVESHQEEQIGDLEEIAIRRGFIKDKLLERL